MIAPETNKLLRNARYGRRLHRKNGSVCSASRIFSYEELLRERGIPVLDPEKIKHDQKEYKKAFCLQKAEGDTNKFNPLPKKPVMINNLISITVMIATSLFAPLLAALSLLNLEPKTIFILYALIVILTSLLVSSKIFKRKMIRFEEETFETLKKRQSERDYTYRRLQKEANWLTYDLEEYVQFTDQPVPEVHLRHARTITGQIDSQAKIYIDHFYEDPYIFAVFKSGEKIYFGKW